MEPRGREHRADRAATGAVQRREDDARPARAGCERLADVEIDVGLVLLGRDRRDLFCRGGIIALFAYYFRAAHVWL